MKAKIIALEGKATGEASLQKSIFGLEMRKDILHRVINWQLAKRQAGTHSSLNRSDVAGSTKKLFRQKGTGNARTGNAKSPHKRGGGVAMGPVVRSHAHDLPKKIRALGLKVALSSKQANNKLFVIQGEELKEGKTSAIAKVLKENGIKSALIITGETVNDNLKKAISNIKMVDVLPVQGANVYDIIRRENLLITEAGLKKLEERFDV
ncbi:MAG: 50S ribosomal protein L4 [Rickettsiales bacterium]|nr:50S ribosomal protein L4 [Pseudomonadota bacterium]MDA0967236.1 50S ribosomal protein L4 [Pseudomonadota bacterium]MDG4544104.1 50S ribosomal protein L4 [Rickettsiales bacterium]MDG4546202.1 50S ribosomal protein L4 [Rickettsiales bacterium]MDG4548428.1 50S ribosomal protein L4 [Rickettsiales bacterium]